VPLDTADIWITDAEPRIIEIKRLDWDRTKASAQMEKEHLPYFAGLLGENRLSTVKERCPEDMVITDVNISKRRK